MKKTLVFLSIILLSGCISQAEYDELKKEYDDLKQKYEELSEENTTLAKSNEELVIEKQKITAIEEENQILKDKLLLYRNENGVGVDNKNNNLLSSEEEEYMESLIEVYDFKAQYFNSWLDGNIPGVTFKLRNHGTKTLSKVEITVYFKDNNGKVFAEEKYHPILEAGFDDKYLKPNYVWQMDQDEFYRADSVPAEWKSGNAEFKITDIEFKD